MQKYEREKNNWHQNIIGLCAIASSMPIDLVFHFFPVDVVLSEIVGCQVTLNWMNYIPERGLKS